MTEQTYLEKFASQVEEDAKAYANDMVREDELVLPTDYTFRVPISQIVPSGPLPFLDSDMKKEEGFIPFDKMKFPHTASIFGASLGWREVDESAADAKDAKEWAMGMPTKTSKYSNLETANLPVELIESQMTLQLDSNRFARFDTKDFFVLQHKPGNYRASEIVPSKAAIDVVANQTSLTALFQAPKHAAALNSTEAKAYWVELTLHTWACVPRKEM